MEYGGVVGTLNIVGSEQWRIPVSGISLSHQIHQSRQPTKPRQRLFQPILLFLSVHFEIKIYNAKISPPIANCPLPIFQPRFL